MAKSYTDSANAREVLTLDRPRGPPLQRSLIRKQVNKNSSGYGSTFTTPSSDSNLSLLHSPTERRSTRARTNTFSRRASRRFQQRLFKGKGVFLVLILVVLVNLTYYFAIPSIIKLLDKPLSKIPISTLQRIMWSSFTLVYPFAGFVADVYLGRHSVIRWSMVMIWIALATLSILVAFYEGGYLVGSAAEKVIPFPPLPFLLIGLGGIKANIIPFGVDQLQEPSSEQMSSYISWHYWSINFGGLLGFSILSSTGEFESHIYLSLIVATAVLTVAICLHMIFNNLFDKTRESRNPLGLVIRIIFYAATAKRGPPRRRRAFRYGEIPPSRIDLAKVDYDGKFTHEQVEDVKTFCLILLVYVSLAGAFLSYGGLFTMISHEVSSNTSGHHFISAVQQNLAGLVNTGTIIIFIPFFNNFLFPLLGNYTPNLRKRIAIGILFEIGAGLLCVVIEATDHSSVPELIILPMIPLSIAEILIYITGIEFVYAQSPYAMKGMLFGLFFCTFGLCNALSAALFTTAPDSKTLCLWSSKSISSNCVLWYFVFYTIVAVIGFVVYVFTAAVYRNRSRDVVVNYNAIVAEYYDRSISHVECSEVFL